MADYKSIIKGTYNAVKSKAKDIVESGAVRDAYDRGTTAAKCYANIAKLTLQINGELEDEKNIFAEIGRLYYRESGGVGAGDFAPLYQELWSIQQKIEDMRAELDAAKAAVEAMKASKGIDVDILDYVPTEE